MAQSAVADDVFYALSNSTRRKVLEQLSVGPATVSELAAPFDMKLPSFVQHLSVLERSRLVKSKKRGRVRTYEIAPERFKVAEDWLTERRQVWESRFDRFDEYVKQLKEKDEIMRSPGDHEQALRDQSENSISFSNGSSTLPGISSGKR